jgi:hypothetical protein
MVGADGFMLIYFHLFLWDENFAAVYCFPDLRLKVFGEICVRGMAVVCLYTLMQLGIIFLGG